MTGTPSDPALRFEILGDVRALRGTEEVDLGPAKQRAVLAVLLLNAGRPVPTHQIVDAVWGDEPPENGSNVVQKYVAGLRRMLEPDRSPRTPGELIALANGGYVLRVDAGALDADRFQAGLAQATTERKAGQLAEAADQQRADQ
ncbi:helix-turn-helix domain-containing protein, partial [Actinoplanes sp. NPDC048791]|uniref:AfsR/SARP family transcriptional regulator n=1 Tax=Actinoplanes sp. NPDC048791 TaxID=3154623 RepID=UPI0033C346F9